MTDTISDPNHSFKWLCRQCDKCWRVNAKFTTLHQTKLGECFRCGSKNVIVAFCHGFESGSNSEEIVK